MPKPALCTLVWSPEQQHYAARGHGPAEQCFRPGDQTAFACWLAEQIAFAFTGQGGRLSVVKEARPRGGGYWYAYGRRDRRTHKRYLGPDAAVTLARLEQVATLLGGAEAPSPRPGTPPAPPSESRAAPLATKLAPPGLPRSLVARARLLRELDAIHLYPLTLVSAAAGSGKTTLLSAWAAVSRARSGQGPALAWLSLDELDNEPARFWDMVIAAVRSAVPTLGGDALALLHAREGPPLSTILAALLNEIAQSAQEIILILDDYHVIADQAIHDGLAFLLDHLPATMRLVVATRADPALPLARLRVRGQLLEIRAAELRFSQAETADFLVHGMGLPLSEDHVAALNRRTEGWIAGLQLAALSLRKQDDPVAWIAAFAGSHRYLLDYVQQDILAPLPPSLQDFLLQTSILTRLNANVCQAVTGLPSHQESQALLEELDRANLFVVPLDEERRWYRYHDLFREALQMRLRAGRPALAPLLHQRAAAYYAASGEPREALAHALAAPDYALAGDLLEQAAPRAWLNGEIRQILDGVLALPDSVLRAHARLALGTALRFNNGFRMSPDAIYTTLIAPVECVITRVAGLLSRDQDFALDLAEAGGIERRLHVLRALIALRACLKRGDRERLRQIVDDLEALPADEEAFWNATALPARCCLTWMLQGEGAQLVERLTVAQQRALDAGEVVLAIRTSAWLALALLRAGALRRAHEECRTALRLLERIDGHSPMVGYVYYALFAVSYAWNRLEEAAGALHDLQRCAQDWQQADHLFLGAVSAARLALARRDRAAAQQALQQAEALAEGGFAHHAAWVRALRVQCWLAQDDPIRASDWAAQPAFDAVAWDPLRKGDVLMLLRVLLAQKEYGKAIETLERCRSRLDTPEDAETAIEFQALTVLAMHHAGDGERRRAAAARLLALTVPEGNIRVYLDAGPSMKQALRALLEDPQLAGSSPAGVASRSHLAKVLAAFKREEARGAHRAAGAGGSPAGTQGNPPYQPPAEPLSPQEIRVLRLLVGGSTYAEMARHLIVSPNTIKTQVSSIYSKLGVSRRAEAIAAAQYLGLL